LHRRLYNRLQHDKSTKQWQQTNFKSGEKYLVSKAKKPGAAWEVKEFGKDHSFVKCTEGFSTVGTMICDDGIFRMSRNNLRFLRVFPHGYWFMNDAASSLDFFKQDGGDTPFIEIGKCSSL
jgi:hypothetical protein